jgi:hypothetical protein
MLRSRSIREACVVEIQIWIHNRVLRDKMVAKVLIDLPQLQHHSTGEPLPRDIPPRRAMTLRRTPTMAFDHGKEDEK